MFSGGAGVPVVIHRPTGCPQFAVPGYRLRRDIATVTDGNHREPVGDASHANASGIV